MGALPFALYAKGGTRDQPERWATRPTMLITFATQGTPNLGPVLLLPGDNNDDMGSFSSVCAPE